MILATPPCSFYMLVSPDLLHGGVLAETSCELLDVVFSQMFVKRLFISPPRNNHEPEILRYPEIVTIQSSILWPESPMTHHRTNCAQCPCFSAPSDYNYDDLLSLAKILNLTNERCSGCIQKVSMSKQRNSSRHCQHSASGTQFSEQSV